MHDTNNCLFDRETNGVLISIINDKWQRGVGGLVLGVMNWWMPRLVAAKQASLAVIPAAATLAPLITHRVRCHFALPGSVSMENLINLLIPLWACRSTGSPEGAWLSEATGVVATHGIRCFCC